MTGPPAPSVRDPLWDVVRAIAIVRVLAWHTWGWAPLSWIGAMPLMFFIAGLFLQRSLERHGFAPTLRERARRLLVPFWLYGTTAVVVMAALGWRPGWSDLLPWALPVVDPVGSLEAPGLWVPLWYLRAYLWFLVLAGLLSLAVRRWSWAVPAALAVVLVAQQLVGPGLSLIWTDLLAYAPFVTAGMVVAGRGLPRRGTAACTALFAVGALALGIGRGRFPSVVNADRVATMVAGVVAVAATCAVAPQLRAAARGVAGAVVAWIGRRALSIYLWQGVGLFAVDRVLTQRGIGGVVGVVASGAVVASTTFAVVAGVGWVEDAAARRGERRPRWTVAASGVVGIALLASALVIVPPGDRAATLPPSGRAVLDNAREVLDDLRAASTAPTWTAPSPIATGVVVGDEEVRRRSLAALDGFVEAHAAELTELQTEYIHVALATVDGAVVELRWERGGVARPAREAGRFALFSLAKAATTGWLVRLAAEGTVGLDDPVGQYLPGVPHGDEITLSMLARHRGGIPARFDSPWFGGDVGGDVRAWLRSGALDFPPGRGYGYSRVGFNLLAWALEEASGTTWQEAVRAMAREAGADTSFGTDDEDVPLSAPNRHPGDGEYRGALFAAGGLVSSPADVARFYHWLFTAGLPPWGLEAMATASADEALGFYGLGVVLGCPCRTGDGDTIIGGRIGHSSAAGRFVHDLSTGTTLMIVPSASIEDGEFIPLFLGDALPDALIAALRQ